MPDNASIWSSESGNASADDALFTAFEDEFGVCLPESFREMYRIHNGGCLQDVEWPDYLLPLSTTTAAYERICSMQKWAESGSMLSADDLDWIEEEYGDPGLVFPLSSDGHTTFALDYNQTDPSGEPSVIYVDFECTSNERVALSFSAWIKQLTRSETESAVDWEEHQRYPVLFQDSFTTDLTEHGKPEQIEHILCREHEQGLLLFTRTRSEGRVLGLSRVALPRGVDTTWFTVDTRRPAPVNIFQLHLQPVEIDDIHWIESRQTQDGTWKNEKSDGVPIYCVVESKDRDALERLADELREAGFVHEPPPPDDSDIPAEFRDEMKQMQQMAEALMHQQQAMQNQAPPEIPTEAPVQGGDPEAMNDNAIIQELSQIILYYAGQVKDVASTDDAQQLIERFAPHTRRYVDLLRQLDVASGPMKGVPLRPAEQVSTEAMQELLPRCPEAYDLLDRHGRTTLMEAMRPKAQDAGSDEFVQRFIKSTGDVADLLSRAMQGKSIDPHREQLQEALREYAECDQRFAEMCSELETGEIGWIHQKRLGSQEFASLQRNWSEFRTRHRKLFKKNRDLFQALEDWL